MAKPLFTAAADMFAAEPKVAYAAVDCTVHEAACAQHDVKGFPTFVSFTYGKNPMPYQGERTVCRRKITKEDIKNLVERGVR